MHGGKADRRRIDCGEDSGCRSDMGRAVVSAAPLTWRCWRGICWQKQKVISRYMRIMAANELVCCLGATRQLLLVLPECCLDTRTCGAGAMHEEMFYKAIWQLVRGQQPDFVAHRHRFRSGNRQRHWVICSDQIPPVVRHMPVRYLQRGMHSARPSIPSAHRKSNATQAH